MLDGPDNDLFRRSRHLRPGQLWPWSLSRLRSGDTHPSLEVTGTGGCGRDASPEGAASSTFSWMVKVGGDGSGSSGGKPCLLGGGDGVLLWAEGGALPVTGVPAPVLTRVQENLYSLLPGTQ